VTHHHPPIFTPDALPAATLPIYPGLGQAPNMLACIPSGLVLKHIIQKDIFDMLKASQLYLPHKTKERKKYGNKQKQKLICS